MITAKLNKIKNALCEVTAQCYHYRRPENVKDKYIIWQEDGEDQSFSANNRKEEQQLHGTVDYFTTQEFDPIIDGIQDALADCMTGWRLNQVSYEDETNLIHYEWEFWAA